MMKCPQGPSKQFILFTALTIVAFVLMIIGSIHAFMDSDANASMVASGLTFGSGLLIGAATLAGSVHYMTSTFSMEKRIKKLEKEIKKHESGSVKHKALVKELAKCIALKKRDDYGDIKTIEADEQRGVEAMIWKQLKYGIISLALMTIMFIVYATTSTIPAVLATFGGLFGIMMLVISITSNCVVLQGFDFLKRTDSETEHGGLRKEFDNLQNANSPKGDNLQNANIPKVDELQIASNPECDHARYSYQTKYAMAANLAQKHANSLNQRNFERDHTTSSSESKTRRRMMIHLQL